MLKLLIYRLSVTGIEVIQLSDYAA